METIHNYDTKSLYENTIPLNFGQLSLSSHKTPIYKLILKNGNRIEKPIETINDYEIQRAGNRIYLLIDNHKMEVSTYQKIAERNTFGGHTFYSIDKTELINELNYILTNELVELKIELKEIKTDIKHINKSLKLINETIPASL